MNLEEAEKLDKALMINRMLKNEFKMERKLSFDGDNYLFRIPKEFTGKISKRKVEILPMSSKGFCAIVR